MESRQEEPAQMDSPRAGDGLERAHSLLSNRRAVRTDEELLRGGGELGEAFDAEILVERRIVVDGFTGLLLLSLDWRYSNGEGDDKREYLDHRGQQPGLVVVIPIGPDDQRHLLVRRILLELLDQPEERIGRGHRHIRRRKHRRSRGRHDV